MKTSDIFTAYISWPGGGKRRPAYVIDDNEGVISFYKITTKYQKKSDKIKKKYFKIRQYQEAGLKYQSYIDTITLGKLKKKEASIKYLGQLTDEDEERFMNFLSRQN